MKIYHATILCWCERETGNNRDTGGCCGTSTEETVFLHKKKGTHVLTHLISMVAKGAEQTPKPLATTDA